MKEAITLSKIKKDLQQIVGKKIAKAWKGYGSAIFLELGALHNELTWKNGGKPAAYATGEWTLSSDGAWKIRKSDSDIFDAETASKEEIMERAYHFEGLSITSVTMTDALVFRLSDGSFLEFYKEDYGFFTLVSNIKRVISYEQNTPYLQSVVL
jgi:hypothetical protein